METKYTFENKTPDAYKCIIGACPAIYEGFKEVTPESNFCIAAACPGIFSSKQQNDVYLIIGKLMPKDSLKNVGLSDLEKKIGKDEVLIEVPKGLIDDFKSKK